VIENAVTTKNAKATAHKPARRRSPVRAGDHAVGCGPCREREVVDDADALPDHDSRRRVIDRISEQAGDRRVPGGIALPVRPRQDACQLLDAAADGLDAGCG
jgi:hypothetical protein